MKTSETRYQKIINNLKSNRVISILLVVFVIYIGVSQVLKVSFENYNILNEIFNFNIDEQELLIDARDNQSYRIATIGNKAWMMENLKYLSEKSLCSEHLSHPACRLYGNYYTFSEALTSCPKGWHLPSINEWMELFRNYSDEIELMNGNNEIYRILEDEESINFEMKFGGRNFADKLRHEGEKMIFWTSTKSGESIATDISFNRKFKTLTKGGMNFSNDKNRLNCRCVIDE